MNNKTGQLIEKYRKEKNLTQVELADKLGVSKSAISKWENGNNLPDITLLEPLSEILGIDKLLLFTSEYEAKEESNEKTKQVKKKDIFKIITISILFIFSIAFTNYISYKLYKHKLSILESQETSVYRFYSTDEEYYVNGYIIFQNGESTILFDQLKYQDIHQSRAKSKEEIKSLEISMLVDNQEVITRYREVENDDINKSLYQLITNKYKDENMTIDNRELKNLIIRIVINKDTNKTIKDIKLEISPEI
ncbi:MAG: helix-turn-helix transcriptional regulator [Firmicutes bacterium]|nr:helix-turn-helix transcriptional regulator [Bacillota bacterium]